MKCLVKGCENDAFQNMLCKEHFDPEKQPPENAATTGRTPRERMPVGQQMSLAAHAALLLSGKLAGSLVKGYKGLFSLTPKERARIFEHIGSTSLKEGRETDSVSAFESAVELDPGNPDALCKLGKAYAATGEHEKARKCFGRVVELVPDDAEAVQAMGEACYNCEDFESALKRLTKARSLFPQSDKIAYLIGLTYDKLGAFEKAVKFLQSAVNMNPREAKYYYSLGFAYDSNGMKEKALENFKKAMELEKVQPK
ncbi:MAG TPA: tetratricopeptide repeat protein [Sumerlaeia bacterium]|nr:tetratricopeptide repeat protein [Sumerlaeia bacterium]